jgi:hypothetical protein
LAGHRQTRYIVSGGPARGEIPGITRNTPSSAKFYTSHTSPAAASKTLLTPGGWVATRARRICLRCSIRTLADTSAVAAQIRLILNPLSVSYCGRGRASCLPLHDRLLGN